MFSYVNASVLPMFIEIYIYSLIISVLQITIYFINLIYVICFLQFTVLRRNKLSQWTNRVEVVIWLGSAAMAMTSMINNV